MTIDVWLYNSGSDTAQCTSGQPLQLHRGNPCSIGTESTSSQKETVILVPWATI